MGISKLKLTLKQKIRVFIGKHRTIYYIVFKVVMPFLLTMLQLDYVCAVTSSVLVYKYNAYIRNATLSLICYVAFFVFLCLLPRFSSVLEFIIHPLFFVVLFKYRGLGSWYSQIAIVASIVLILAKIIFFLEFIVEDEVDSIREGNDYYYDNR